MEPRLTGREWETATLAEILAKPNAGRLVLISGEAGIGKTRLADHALQLARENGFAVLSGQADPLQAGLAYAPIVAALRAHLDRLPEQESTRLLAGLPDLGRLLTDPRLPPPPSGGDPALNRTHMFEAVLRLLQLCTPLVLFVDDLHWADDGTIELVHYLGRGTANDRLVVIGTCRTPQTGQRLTELATLVRRHGTELVLGPLSDNAVADLLADVLGTPPEPALLQEMAKRTKGVPLFVRALAPHADTAGPMPAIVRDVVLSRLRALDELERDLLDLIAVAGTAATMEILQTAWPVEDLTASLHKLLRQGHIDEQVSGSTLAYRVAHPLYAEVAYAELTEAERRKLHAKVARAIDAHSPDNVVALAPHYRGAGDLVDPQRAIDVYTAAGQRAMNVLAAREAVEYFNRAVDFARTDRPEQLAELLDYLGLAQQGAADLDGATQTWLDRLAMAEQAGDIGRQASLRVQLAILASERGDADGASEHVAARMRLTGELDILSALLQLTVASRHWDAERSKALFDHQIAGFADDPRPTAQLARYVSMGFRAALDGDFASAHRWLSEVEEFDYEPDTKIDFLPFNARRFHIGICLLLGDIPTAARLATSDAPIQSATFVLPSAGYSMRLVNVTMAYFTGELTSALTELDQDIRSVQDLGLRRIRARMSVHKAHLLAELGRIDEARRFLQEAKSWRDVHDNAFEVGKQTVNAVIAFHTGYPEQAPRLDMTGFSIREPLISSTRVLVAGQVAAAANDLPAARAILDFLRRLGERAPLLRVMADRQEGLIAAAEGKPAYDLLHDAARRLHEMGALFLATQADLEAEENTPTPDQAIVLNCLATFQQIGAAPWIDRTRRLARAHGMAVRTERTDGELTKRELEVVRLVGHGLSNADIANRLFLSARTVETHLRNSYRKLDITSRIRLAQWAAENT